MTIVPLIFALMAMACLGGSLLIARIAWPRFQAMERRGDMRGSVPVHLMGPGSDRSRLVSLFWRTPIPEDRPQLKRLVLAYRLANIAGLVLIIATALAIWASAGVRSNYTPRPDGRPTVTIPISAQDH